MPETLIYKRLQHEWQALVAKLPNESLDASDMAYLSDPATEARPFVLFAELEDTRIVWKEMVKQFKDGEYADRFVTRLWTVKDLIAHVSSWASEFRQQVEIALSGQSFDYVIPYALSAVGPTDWNQVEVEKRRSRSMENLDDEFDTETRRLQELILKLPEEFIRAEFTFPMAPTGDPSMLWKASIAQIFKMRCTHDRWHMERIRQWQDSFKHTPGE